LDSSVRDVVLVGFAFAFGAAIGSFLNVVIYRLPRRDEGLTLTTPRYSRCPACGVEIRGYDNIPLVSYFLLGARCRHCKKSISIRYFVVELLTACCFAYLAVRHFTGRGAAGPGPGPGPGGLPAGATVALFAVEAVLMAALIAVTFIDIDFQIIPDRIDIPGMVLAPVVSVLVPRLHTGADLEAIRAIAALFGRDLPPALGVDSIRLQALISSVLGIGVGGGIIWLIGFLGEKAFRKEAMGFGDVKLLGMIGGYLGFTGALLTLLLASVLGAVIGLGVKLATRESYIPFGPFLAVGAALVLLFRPAVVRLLFEVYPNVFR